MSLTFTSVTPCMALMAGLLRLARPNIFGPFFFFPVLWFLWTLYRLLQLLELSIRSLSLPSGPRFPEWNHKLGTILFLVFCLCLYACLCVCCTHVNNDYSANPIRRCHSYTHTLRMQVEWTSWSVDFFFFLLDGVNGLSLRHTNTHFGCTLSVLAVTEGGVSWGCEGRVLRVSGCVCGHIDSIKSPAGTSVFHSATLTCTKLSTDSALWVLFGWICR